MMLLMYTTLIAGATFAAVLGGYAVQKIFYCVFGAIPYLYLFFSVAGSFDIKFGFVQDHPWATAIVLVGGEPPDRDPCPRCTGRGSCAGGARRRREARSSATRARTSRACSCRA